MQLSIHFQSRVWGRLLTRALLTGMLAFSQPAHALIVDHTCTTLEGIPASYVEVIKQNTRIFFASASHGRQLLTGMERIAEQNPLYAFYVDWTLPVLENTVCMQYQNLDPFEYFGTVREYLKAEPSINVAMFFWCSEANWYDVNIYFAQMESLEVELPNVKFVYATGHAQEDGCAGCNRHRFNEAVRDYCLRNNKILFDFADMDAWYNGEMETYISPGYCVCAGEQIPIQHTQYYPVEDNHTSFENCENKGRAVWWMLAKIAGWSQTTPVELSHFSALTTGEGVLLSWETASESGNSGFGIERSRDGKQYAEIAFRPGEGTSRTPHLYSYLDPAVEHGVTYYYRLRQVDRDGAATYSAVVTAIVKAPALFELNQSFPNPFHGMTRFSYLLPQDSWITISVFDLTGREVALLKRGMSGMGERMLQWDGRDAKGSRVSDGLYLLKMREGLRTAVRRMVLLN